MIIIFYPAKFNFTGIHIKNGITNINANRNLDKKVEIVASHISFVEYSWSASLETCTPTESENASAIAIVKIPLITTPKEPVPEYNPTIIPSGVTNE